MKYDFQATNQQELSIRSGQAIYIAPREIQNTQKLLNTGWVLATLDNQTSGIIPLNYVQGPQQVAAKPNIVPISEEMQPKNIQNTGHVIAGCEDMPPAIPAIPRRSPEEIMAQVFADDV